MIEIKPHQMKIYENVIGDVKFEFKSTSTTGFIQVYVNENYIERVTIPPHPTRLFKAVGAYGGDIQLINTGPATIMVSNFNSNSNNINNNIYH